jgi:hypothetical protein
MRDFLLERFIWIICLDRYRCVAIDKCLIHFTFFEKSACQDCSMSSYIALCRQVSTASVTTTCANRCLSIRFFCNHRIKSNAAGRAQAVVLAARASAYAQLNEPISWKTMAKRSIRT